MAHGGEELALGPVGVFGLLLRALEFDLHLPPFGQVGDRGNGPNHTPIPAVGNDGHERVNRSAIGAADTEFKG